jgi:hypothetical protein
MCVFCVCPSALNLVDSVGSINLEQLKLLRRLRWAEYVASVARRNIILIDKKLRTNEREHATMENIYELV